MISFNMRSEYGLSSYIKFGGYDTMGMKDNTTDSMNFFRTVDEKTWTLPVESFKAYNNSETFNIEGLKNVAIDPSVPYIYVEAQALTYDNFLAPLEK